MQYNSNLCQHGCTMSYADVAGVCDCEGCERCFFWNDGGGAQCDTRRPLCKRGPGYAEPTGNDLLPRGPFRPGIYDHGGRVHVSSTHELPPAPCVDDPEGLVAKYPSSPNGYRVKCHGLTQGDWYWASDWWKCDRYMHDFSGEGRYVWELCPLACGKCTEANLVAADCSEM